jgi:hypothetical protein
MTLRFSPHLQVLVSFLYCYLPDSGDSSVGTATHYGLDGRGSILGRGKTFLFSLVPRPELGPTQPPIQQVTGVKRPGREADRSPLSSAEVKNGGLYLEATVCLHGTVLNSLSTRVTLPFAFIIPYLMSATTPEYTRFKRLMLYAVSEPALLYLILAFFPTLLVYTTSNGRTTGELESIPAYVWWDCNANNLSHERRCLSRDFSGPPPGNTISWQPMFNSGYGRGKRETQMRLLRP